MPAVFPSHFPESLKNAHSIKRRRLDSRTMSGNSRRGSEKGVYPRPVLRKNPFRRLFVSQWLIHLECSYTLPEEQGS